MRRNRSRFFDVEPPSEAVESDLDLPSEAAWPELRLAAREPANAQGFGLWQLAECSDRLTRWRPVIVKGRPRSEPPTPDWPSPDWPDAA